MEYIGFDYHKQSTFATSINVETGEIRTARLSNTSEALSRFIRKPSETHAVLEASRTWSVFYELVKDHVAGIKLAHPLKVKAIASARIKTDRIDSRILAELLSADLIPEAHLREEGNRRKQQLLRQRAFFVGTSTRVKNRIHVLIDRQAYEVRRPLLGLLDIFGKAGMQWLRQTQELSRSDRRLLDQMLVLYDCLQGLIKESDNAVDRLYRDDEDAQLLSSLPGVGRFFSVLLSTEIDGIARFLDAAHLASYTGLIPSTYASGTVVRHGRITKQGNKWLRWCYGEAASRAKVLNAQLNGYYARLEKRIGKKKATIALARRMVTISYKMLREQRPFEVYQKPNRQSDTSRVAFTRP
jgi:transposase